MKIKDYLIAVATATAAVASFITVVIIVLLALIGWGVVWALGVIITLPIAYKLVQEYRESGYRDYIVFLIDKFENKIEDKPKKSSIDW